MGGADWVGAVGGDLRGAKWVSVLTWLWVGVLHARTQLRGLELLLKRDLRLKDLKLVEC